MDIFGYEITEKIYESPNSIIYRAVENQSSTSVIIKILNYDYPSEEKIAQFKYEYELIHNINSKGVIAEYELIHYKNSYGIVFEDIGGISLNKIDFSKWKLINKLTLFMEIITILEKIHSNEIIHKDINPSNIILNEKTGVVKIIDFGNATKLIEEKSEAMNKNVVEGTLAYISPEQTGRVNRVIDHRSDYYSLGATFYELLVLKKVFHSVTDPAELIYCHLAKEPISLYLLNKNIPITVSNIVMKFLAKNAEDRYQSILGIKLDLQKCIESLKTKGVIEDFSIASKDNLNKFQVSQKLYGRKKELANLMAVYNHVCNGRYEFMLLSGPSGIGKSDLVHEMQQFVFQRKGSFISGKYDRHKNKIPYSAIIDAFKDLIKVVLTENSTTIQSIQNNLKEKLGNNGKVITNVIPELEFLIGKQPPVEELPAIESQHRFNFIFKEFVTSFLRPGNALVIFLDDLQWADNASIELIKNISAGKDNHHLFIIGSYRDNEVDQFHSLELAVNELEKQNLVIKKIKLTPLALEDITELVADTLHVDRESILDFSRLLYERTAGNPFFITEFLGQLYEKKLIYFDNETLCWAWDLEIISHAGFASSIFEMIAEKIKTQDENTQRILKIAAIIGNRFDYMMLLELENGKREEVTSGLWKALKEGFIHPLDSSYKYIKNAKINSTFKFVHDGIQQVIYSLIDEAEKRELHLKIGRMIRGNCPQDHLKENIFDIVTHLNFSLELITNEKEIQEIAELNYLAGVKAKGASAFISAFEYFNLAIKLFGPQIWSYNQQRALEIYINGTEAAYSCAQYYIMENYSDIAFEKCDHSLSRIKLYEIKILALLAKNNASGAVEVALEALQYFNIVFPKKISKGYLLYKLTLLKFSLYGKNLEKISDYPYIKDEEKAAVMRLLTTVSSSAYLTAPDLFVLMVIKQIEISIKHGNSIQTPFAFCMYGVILCGLLDDINSGYQLGKIGLDILKKVDYKELAGKTLVVGNIFINHWKDKPDIVLSELIRAYTLSQETGDVEYAAWALLCHGFHSFFAGKNIKKLNQDLLNSSEKIANEYKQEKQYHYIVTFIQLIKKFHEQNGNKTNLSTGNYDEAKILEMHTENHDKNGLYYVYSNKMILNLFFENYPLAIQAGKQAEKYIDSVLSTINYPVFYFYSTLAYLGMYDSLDVHDKKKVEHNLKKIKKWAMISPDNHQYKYHLLTAEILKIEQQYEKATVFFDLAINAALKHGFIQDAALAYELASKFYTLRDKEMIAKAYMIESHYFYQKWGADTKVLSLEEENSYLRKWSVARDTSISSNSWTANQFVDTASIVKIAQLLSSEIQYDNLIRKMMNILMQNAGAQKGFFLIQRENRLLIEATVNINDDHCTVLNGLEISEVTDLLSKAIVYYVLRIEESIVIHDAVNDKLFAKDTYIQRCRPKSILCIPVLTKNKLMGVLYFENNLTTEAFTQDRTEFLKIVASQAAISLENINMYTNLEEKVKERTREIEIQKSFFQQLFATSPDGIVLLNNELCVTNINSTFEKLFQYSLVEIKGRYIDDILIPSECMGENTCLRAMERKETVRLESVRKRKDDSLIDVYITVYPIMAEDTQVGLCVMYSDISTRKQAEKQLRYLSLHDSLTGLYNRTCFEEEMTRLGKMRNLRVGIIVCDVDSLKLINDTLGHEVGDRLIKAAAHIIKETFRGSDIAARIGGDEFAILIPNAERSTLDDCSARLQLAISRHNLSAMEYNLSISVGFALKEENMMFMEDAFKEADSNMYNDKLAKSAVAKEEIVKKLLTMLETKDFFHHGHVKGLQSLIRKFGKKLNLSKNTIEQLDLLAQFHDIGKVVLPEAMICKAEKLTLEEFSEVQKHPEVGYRIVKSIPDVKHIADWIIKHHEWWNGSGYPLGIKGENIPFECRLFAIVDAYEVMTSGRPYCKALTKEEALHELNRCSGSQFDPKLVQDFVNVISSGGFSS